MAQKVSTSMGSKAAQRSKCIATLGSPASAYIAVAPPEELKRLLRPLPPRIRPECYSVDLNRRPADLWESLSREEAAALSPKMVAWIDQQREQLSNLQEFAQFKAKEAAGYRAYIDNHLQPWIAERAGADKTTMTLDHVQAVGTVLLCDLIRGNLFYVAHPMIQHLRDTAESTR
jgi:hypothetical protein